MLRYTFIIFFVIYISNAINGNAKLSENSKISVLTCSEGEELYSAFGHSSLRVFDPDNNIDLVFNYGTFDFNTPNFYLKFANGKLNYKLSVSKYKYFLPEYFRESRNVTEQVLNLNLKNRQQIFDALIINYQPENRFYKYDFFYDNCATRIYDIISDNIDVNIILDNNFNDSITFRKYLHHYLDNSPWIETGLNMILGLPADKIATLKESTYLPDFLLEVLQHAKIQNDEGTVGLIKEEIELLDFTDKQIKEKPFFTPLLFFWTLLLVSLIISIMIKSKALFYYDRFLFLIAGCVGILISYLWLITDHSVTGNNFNILWCLPTFLFLAFAKQGRVCKLIARINFISIAIFLITWKLLPQAYPLATIPIALLLGYKSFVRIRQ